MLNIFSENIPWSIGIIVVLFGIIAAHRLVSYRDKRSTFNAAANSFLVTFSPSIARIDSAIFHVGSHNQPEVNDFLRENFEAHSVAVKQFEKYVPWHKQKKYKKTWQEYCDLEPYGGGITLFAGHHAPDGEYLEFIKEKLENIVKFTKPS